MAHRGSRRLVHVHDFVGGAPVPYLRAWRWQQRLLALRTALAPPPAAPAPAPPQARRHRDLLLLLEHAPA